MARQYIVYIGLGSNIGRRTENIMKALRCLCQNPQVRLRALSSLYRTSPIGPAQRDFVNAVAKLTTTLTPEQLLAFLKDIERDLGRLPSQNKWGPRIIDLDLLLYDQREIRSSCLVIPHPELARRRFVLEPLAEIAPGLVHPILRKTARKLRDLLRLTSPDQKVTIIKHRTKKGS